MTRYSNNAINNFLVAPTVDIMQVYEDSGNAYICNAEPGTILTAAAWKIVRFDVNGNKRKCDGNDLYDNLATDAATVAALSYS